MKKNIFMIICFSTITLGNVQSQVLQSTIKNKNQEGIPYASLGIPSKGFGIVTNDAGSFTYKITFEKPTDTLQITSIGYNTLVMNIAEFETACKNNSPIYLADAVYELQDVTIRAGEYETKVFGNGNTADLKCGDMSRIINIDTTQNSKERNEKGIDEKFMNIELGNKFKIEKGQQNFINKIEFKSCQEVNDTAIYRVNIYTEGELKKKLTPIGFISLVKTINILKEPIIVIATGKTEVYSIDLSNQNIEVSDDFIVGLECIYTSNKKITIGADAGIFGKNQLLIRPSFEEIWFKIPALDLTFISATCTYLKKPSFWQRVFN